MQSRKSLLKDGRVIKTTRRNPKRDREMIKTTKAAQSKELAVKESSAVQAQNAQMMQDLSEFGEVSSQDILIPRILLMQGMSEMVTGGQAKFGELRENINMSCLGGAEAPLEVIPFKYEKVWREQEEGAKQPKRIVPIFSNPADQRYNENLPHEFFEKDEKGRDIAMRRFKTFRFFAMLPSKIQSMPYVLEFKSTSLKAGMKIVNQAMENVRAKKKPWSVFEITVTKTKNDKGTFAVMDVKLKREPSKEESEIVQSWMNQMKSSKVTVIEEESPSEEVPF